MQKQGYGYIEFVDPRKLKHDGWDDNIDPEIRKPTPSEREEIILNLIRDNSGKPIRITKLAELLAVSDRTIQKVFRNLENKTLIRRTSHFDKNNKQQANIYEYIGENTPKSNLTLENLYNPDNPCGFRDWHWEEYKFIPGVYDENFTKEDAKMQYLFLSKRTNALAEKRAKNKKNNDN